MKDMTCASAWEFARLAKTQGITLKGRFDSNQLTPRIRNKVIKTLRRMDTHAGGYSSQAQMVMKLIMDKFELPRTLVTKDQINVRNITPEVWEKCYEIAVANATLDRLEGKDWAMKRLEGMLQEQDADKTAFWYYTGRHDFSKGAVDELSQLLIKAFNENGLAKRFEDAANYIEQGGTFEFEVYK
jgi:hypothetical protein